MKKGIRGKKLSRTTNERKQLFRNLIRDTVKHGFITTTLAKAKVVQPQLEKLVTTAKEGTLAHIRRLAAKTGDSETVTKLMEIGKLFAKRPGGYTRIIKMVSRAGDNSTMVRLEWVEKLEKIEVIEPKKPVHVVTKPELLKKALPQREKKTKAKRIQKEKTKTRAKTK